MNFGSVTCGDGCVGCAPVVTLPNRVPERRDFATRMSPRAWALRQSRNADIPVSVVYAAASDADAFAEILGLVMANV